MPTIFNRCNHDAIANTYSIVARDPKTGEMAVAVQSHWFSVGTIVSWGESGVGVVATQSFVNKSFGLRGLDLLKQGKSPGEALEILLSDDEGKEVRQVAILDHTGRVAAHTGAKCIKHAGHLEGNNFSVQANMMLSDKVWPSMADAFTKNENLPLPERVIRSLEAAEAVGGDIRGKQSAALLLVAGKPQKDKWDDSLIDIRVADHGEPFQELIRLLKVYRAYEHMDNGDLAIEKGNKDEALEEYNSARKMFPENLEMQYWTAISLANIDKLEEALVLLEDVFKKDKNWLKLTERLPEVGLLNVKESALERILSLI